jgi:hypothetical protein
LAGSVKNAPGMGDIEFVRAAVLPDSRYTAMQTGMGTISVVVTPKAAFMASGEDSRDLAPNQREDIANSIKRDPFNVAQHVDDPKFVFAAGGTAKVGDVEGSVLDVDADGARARWILDPKNGHILRVEFDRLSQRGTVHRVETNADFRAVDGITLAFKNAISENGEDAGTSEITEFVINPKIDPKLFEKPSPPAQK